MASYLSRKQIALSFAILVVCLVGDKNSKPVKDVDFAAAICDNVTHGFVGMMIWGSVLAAKSHISYIDFYLQILVCGICSSLIDADHFIAAKSFNLKDAANLKSRPILHCTSGALAVCGIMLTVALRIEINWLYKFSWILVTAVLSHHIRDSIRRGFWIWPLGSTKPLPYLCYLAAEALMPQMLSFLVSLTNLSVTKQDDSQVVLTV